jgi:hypothetical protein
MDIAAGLREVFALQHAQCLAVDSPFRNERTVAAVRANDTGSGSRNGNLMVHEYFKRLAVIQCTQTVGYSNHVVIPHGVTGRQNRLDLNSGHRRNRVWPDRRAYARRRMGHRGLTEQKRATSNGGAL